MVEVGRPAGTTKSYGTYIKQYKAYALSKEFPEASEVTLASFMEDRALDGKSRGLCTKTIPSAVASMFRYDDGGNPTKGVLLKEVKMAVAKITKAPVPRIAMPLSLLKRISLHVKGSGPGAFKAVRDYFMILLMTVAMMRGREAVNLLEDDIELRWIDGVEVLMIRIQTSKTDQLRIGDTVFISAGADPATCPLLWFKFY